MACLIASKLVLDSSNLTVTFLLSRSTWTSTTPATERTAWVTVASQWLQLISGTEITCSVAMLSPPRKGPGWASGTSGNVADFSAALHSCRCRVRRRSLCRPGDGADPGAHGA